MFNSTKNIAKLWAWFQINWQRPVSPLQTQVLLERLASDDTGEDIVFETRTYNGEIVFLVATRNCYAEELHQLFEASIPGTTLSPLSAEQARTLRAPLKVAESVKMGHPMMALNTDRITQVTLSIMTAMASVRRPSEGLVLQVMLGGRTVPYTVPRDLKDPRQSGLSVFATGAVPMATEIHAGLQRRHSMHGFQTEVRVGAIARDTIRGGWLLEQLRSGLAMMEAHGARVQLSGKSVQPQMENLTRPQRKWSHLLSSQEVSCLMGIPYNEEHLPGVPPLHPVNLRPPRIMPAVVDGFATANDPSRPLPIGITELNSLQHTLLLGPTGVGKSTAMLNLILADINAGRGVIVIDPKDDLNSDILARMSRDRKDDVVYIDPTADNIVSINPLTSQGDPDLVADGMLSVLREVFSSSWGQRTEDILSNALMTLTRTSTNVNLSMLPALLYDPVFRRKLVDEVSRDDPMGLGSFWKQYESLTPNKQQEITAPLMNKLRTVLTRKPLLRTVGQPEPNFDLSDLFTKNKIVLVSLNKAKLGSTSARFLGSLILSQIWALTQGQGSLPESKRPIVKVYVDEMQDYLALPVSISDALSQARSYKVGFTLAHQYRDQVRDKELLAGIDSNVANKVFFTLNDPDARIIANMTPMLKSEDFKYLPRHHVYIQTPFGGQKVWMSATTNPAPAVINKVEVFKAYSLKRYGRPAAEIDEAIRRSVGINDDIAAVIEKTPITSALTKTPSLPVVPLSSPVVNTAKQPTDQKPQQLRKYNLREEMPQAILKQVQAALDEVISHRHSGLHVGVANRGQSAPVSPLVSQRTIPPMEVSLTAGAGVAKGGTS